MLLTPLLLAGSLLSSRVSAKAAALSSLLSVPPSADPFYTPPAGFAKKAPGTILRHRTIETAFLGLVPDPVEAYQLLYRTTAINGSAIATVTTVFKPANASLDRFVSFQTAYDSASTTCDPSYNYQLGTVQEDLFVSLEMLILQAFLLSGYVVSSPDYEGPEAAFGPGHLEGMGTLDGMRAVNNFHSTLGLSTASPMIVGVGYSGGAMATSWAASLKKAYAPELDVKGWSSGGTPANLTGVLVYTNGGVFSGFLPDSLEGQSKSSGYGAKLKPLFDRILTPFGKSLLAYTGSNCVVRDLLHFPDQDFLSTKVQSLGADLFYDPTMASVLGESIMGIHKEQTPQAPVYLYHASQDEIIPYANASTLYTNWCKDGATVHFTTFGNGGHITTEILGVPSAIAFTAAAFAGTVGSGCSQSTVLNSTLDPLALGVELEPIAAKLLSGLSLAGLQDSNIIKNLAVLGKTF